MTDGSTEIMKDVPKMRGRKASALLAGLVLAAGSVSAHHGSSISYNVSNLWTTWATVTEFNYKNPHPTMTFDRITKDGEVERWVSELLTNPSMMARQGWTRSRSIEKLQLGTRVKLYIGTARAGGFSGIVMRLEDEDGNEIAGRRGAMEAVDLDGVPGGLQPTVDEVLPGELGQ
jgi:hypothetical protein